MPDEKIENLDSSIQSMLFCITALRPKEMSVRNSGRLVGWFLALAGAIAGLFCIPQRLSPTRVRENVAYVSEEQGSITVVDLKSLKVLRTIDLNGVKPRGINLTSNGQYLVTANKDTADVSVISTESFNVARRIQIGINPEFVKLHPGGRWLFTSHEPASTGRPPTEEAEKKGLLLPPSEIVALDAQNWSVARAFSAGAETEGIEFSRDGKLLIVTNEAESTIAVYEVETGKLIQRLDVTPYGHRPRGVKVSSDGRNYAVTLEGSDELLLLDQSFHVTRSVPTRGGPYGIAFDRSGRRLIVAAAKGQMLQVFDADSLQVLAEVPVGRRCWHFTFTPDDSKILVACGRSNDIHIIDAKSYQVIQVLKGFHMPWGIITYPRAYGSLDLP